VPTHLRAQCEQSNRVWAATVVSLSENGCLLRSPEPMPLGGQLRLRLALPRHGELELAGDVAYQLLPDVGIVFHAVTTSVREVLSGFVSEALGSA
jgi:hypothetical protein